MNLVDNNNTYFNLNTHYSLINMDQENIHSGIDFRKDTKIQNFHLSKINNFEIKSDGNNKIFDKKFNKDHLNAMSLDTIVNKDIHENSIDNINNNQQEKENNSFSNEKLPFIDASRTLPPLTSLTTPTTSSSISTLLNTSISPSLSSPSSEASNHSPINSHQLSISIDNRVNIHNKHSGNQNMRIINKQNTESLFHNNDSSYDVTQELSSKIPNHFIKNENNNINSYSNSYNFNDANIIQQKNINKNGTYYIIIILILK